MHTISLQNAWQRWLPIWYGVFYVMLIIAAIFSLVELPHTLEISLLILGPSLLLGIWYGFSMMTASQHLRSRPLLWLGYLLVGWLLWFWLTSLDSVYLYLLFGLYPQVFMVSLIRWRVIGIIILTALTFWRQGTLLGWSDANLLITPTAAFTGLLMTVFIDAIVRQSEERRRLLSELEAARQELAVAERKAGITQERQRLAREIHDTLVQGFTSIVMHLEVAERALPTSRQVVQRYLAQARRTARENLVEARRLMWALQPEMLDRATLSEALTNLARSWSEERATPARVTVTGSPRSLRPELEATLLRATQEALTNAGKYAQASEVSITLSYMEDMVILDVQDDGCGFDTTRLFTMHEEQMTNGFGLRALRARVEQLSGTLSIESEPGEGTTIAASLPAIDDDVSVSPELIEEKHP